VQTLFAKPPDDSRILMRWWWFGPSVTTVELEAEMRRMREGGIGGFELAVVYPMALDDPARGIRNERYLSREFLEKVGFTSRKARELGLRMDVTIGSGWSYGGPYITPDLAATRLRSDRREITPDRTSLARPVPYEGDRLIAAFVGRGSLAEVDPTTFRELDVSGAGTIPLPPGQGPRLVLLYFSGQTGQLVKRAAVGAEGYVLDHYQRAALETHLREAGDKLLAAAGTGGVHAAFCDSLEVYGGDWTADMLGESRSGVATTCAGCCRCSSTTSASGPRPSGATSAAPSPSFTRSASSPPCARGRPRARSSSASRTTESRPRPWPAPATRT